MEEELNYAAVMFKPNVVSDVKTNNEDTVIYDELRTEENTTCLLRQKHPSVISEKGKKAPVCTCLHVVAASLGFICIILISVIVILCVHCHHLKKDLLSANTVISDQLRENQNLTEVNHQLWNETSELQRQTKELSRERDDLNWTMGVIMEYDDFPVHSRCPRKVCTPCEDGWVPFQSHCYFLKSGWKSWSTSQDECKKENANLVVIESQEEQEFISNRTATSGYYGGKHFWIGLTKQTSGKWSWIDGSNLTVQYWEPEQGDNKHSCARIVLDRDGVNPLSNWHKADCNTGASWICEKRALIKHE